MAADTFERNISLAEAAADLGRWDYCLRHVGAALRIDPESAYGHYLEALALFNLKRLDEALDSIDQCLKKQPGNSAALVIKGAILTKFCFREEAEQAFREAERIDPRSPIIKFELAWLYRYRLFNNAMAIEMIRAAIELNPSDAGFHAFLGSRLLEEGRHSEALDAARTALKLDPVLADAHFLMGKLRRKTDFNAGMLDIAEAARLDPQKYGGVYENYRQPFVIDTKPSASTKPSAPAEPSPPVTTTGTRHRWQYTVAIVLCMIVTFVTGMLVAHYRGDRHGATGYRSRFPYRAATARPDSHWMSYPDSVNTTWDVQQFLSRINAPESNGIDQMAAGDLKLPEAWLPKEWESPEEKRLKKKAERRLKALEKMMREYEREYGERLLPEEHVPARAPKPMRQSTQAPETGGPERRLGDPSDSGESRQPPGHPSGITPEVRQETSQPDPVRRGGP